MKIRDTSIKTLILPREKPLLSLCSVFLVFGPEGSLRRLHKSKCTELLQQIASKEARGPTNEMMGRLSDSSPLL